LVQRRIGARSFVVLAIVLLSASLVAARSFALFENHAPAKELVFTSKVVEGVARAIDGDTVALAGIHVRLNGVAAPERNEPGGPEATKFLAHMIDGNVLHCSLDGTKSYERFVGICFLDNRDVGSAVISAGLARDCPRFSGGRYAAVETAAGHQLVFPSYCRIR
tara:strand:+ start:7019 stop:7510 length:492 start_codon:yes stop_codon:yes gene_type:complete